MLERTARVVAADGGAARALDFGRPPDLVIGDFDSFTPDPRLPEARLLRIAEQDSTDFEKCLQHVSAPRVLALGFMGRRMDHSLAVLSALVARVPGWCVLIGEHDIVVHCPPRLALDLVPGSRLSLYPLRRVTGRSQGLQWPIDGLTFAPDARIGTSNRVTGPLRLDLDGEGMLLILPRGGLLPLLEGLEAG